MIVGEDSNQSVTDQLIEWIESTYPDVEIEQHEGDNRFINISLQSSS